MRTLVLGATGYVGGRLIPELLERGHEVLAGARDPEALDAFTWGDRVQRVEVDVLEPDSVDRALSGGVDAIAYLVHGLDGKDFRELDRRAASNVREAADRAGVTRIAYVSGIVPPIEEDQLSEHLISRLEVERELSAADADVVTLRAAMIMGAGSTSYELMAQLARRLPVTVIPDWMQQQVEPIAIVDVVAAAAGALDRDLPTGHFDVGGGEPLPYPELLDRYVTAAGFDRSQITVPLLPEPVVAKFASAITDLPSSTVQSLMESLREDMIAREHHWIGALVDADHRPVSLEESLRRALAPASDDPMTAQPGDPDWAFVEESGDERSA